MSKNKPVDWQTTADILDNATDEEIREASEKLDSHPGQTAGEAVEEALAKFQEMGLMPKDGEEPDHVKQMEAMARMMAGDFDYMMDDDEDEDDD